MKRVVFINRFYWPAEPATAQLLADLAELLAERGWDVCVVTGRSTPELPLEERHRGVTIIRIGSAMTRSNSLVRRARDLAVFHFAAVFRLPRILRAGDVAVALTDPPLLGLTVAIAAGLRGARFVHWVHDIYPEVVHSVASSSGSWLLNAVLRPFRNLAWRRAAACVTLGDDMAAVVRSAGVATANVRIIPNWAPKNVQPPAPSAVQTCREKWGIAGRFVIGYSGNLGRVHDLNSVLDVAHELQSDPAVLFLFVGHGAGFALLKAGAEQRRLGNVRFLPPQPRRDLAISLAVPDLHIVSVRAGCERFVFPSKLYGIAAVHRPVLVLSAPDAEVARVVEQHGMGAAFRPDEAPAIAAFLRGVVADRDRLRAFADGAARFNRTNGGASAGASAWEALLRGDTLSTSPSTPATTAAIAL